MQQGPRAAIIEIYNLLAQSEQGGKLSDKIRYDPYKPPNFPDVSWVEIFGDDANKLKHHILTLERTERFVAHCDDQSRGQISNPLSQFDSEERYLLCATAVTHDFGKAGLLEDVNSEEKTKESRFADELRYLHGVLSQLCVSGAENSVGEANLLEIVNILEDTESKLGQAFSTIERIGYVENAIRAWLMSHFMLHDDDLCQRLKWLASNLLSNNISKMIELGKIYPAVERFLDFHSSRITEAFKEMPNAKFSFYADSPEERSFEGKFGKAKSDWLDWYFAGK